MLDRLSQGGFGGADSPVHRLDPRGKLLANLLFMIAALLVANIAGLLFLLAVVLLTIWVAQVPYRRALGGFRLILYILVFTVVIHSLSPPPAGGLLPAFSLEGLSEGLFFSLRLALLVLGTSVLTLTTSPLELGDAIESLMTPLRRVRVPARDIALTISLSLRFIPTLVSEAERIVKAQMARGADFAGGGILRKGRVYMSLLIPMLVSALRRAGDIGLSLESRCYGGDAPRTRYNELVWSRNDWLALALVTAILALALVVGRA